jgi:hypothetical protein
MSDDETSKNMKIFYSTFEINVFQAMRDQTADLFLAVNELVMKIQA